MPIQDDAPALAQDVSENLRCALQVRAVPRADDVLASRRTARSDVYSIGIVAGAPQMTSTRYSAAIEMVRELARERRVDGWFTCDHTHYSRVARFRRG